MESGYVDLFLERIYFLIPVIMSLSVHEWAHAQMAYRLGDDTAFHLGRLTLNPIAHIDPIGTVILPLLGIPIGWAKPVPFNPTRFRSGVSMAWGGMLVALAGPISNLVLAGICTSFILMVSGCEFSGCKELLQLLYYSVFINIMLALFNLLPIPPLDGSHVVNALIPRSARWFWQALAPYGPLIILALVFLPYLTTLSPLTQVAQLVEQWLSGFLVRP